MALSFGKGKPGEGATGTGPTIPVGKNSPALAVERVVTNGEPGLDP